MKYLKPSWRASSDPRLSSRFEISRSNNHGIRGTPGVNTDARHPHFWARLELIQHPAQFGMRGGVVTATRECKQQDREN